MDTTDIYISMCEKAVEIQYHYRPRAGDTVYFKGRLGFTFSLEDSTQYAKWRRDNLVWQGNYWRTGLVSATHGYTSSHLGYGDFRAVVVEGFYFPTEDCVVLPRQDDLQKLLGYGLSFLVTGFYSFITDNPDYTGSFTSMEQQWLAHVMMERFRKVWSGSDWCRV